MLAMRGVNVVCPLPDETSEGTLLKRDDREVEVSGSFVSKQNAADHPAFRETPSRADVLPYLRQASRVVAAEPDPAMRRRLVAKTAAAEVPVDVDDSPAEALPYADRALAEARRVLRSGGRLIALEHVRGDGRLARWQDRITPLWTRLAAGCHPGRATRTAVERAGFTFVEVEEFQPMPRWMPVSPWLHGVAETAP